MCFNSVLGVLYIHTIVVMRRIVLVQFHALFLCNGVLFLSFCFCLHVCVCAGPLFWHCDRTSCVLTLAYSTLVLLFSLGILYCYSVPGDAEEFTRSYQEYHIEMGTYILIDLL